MSFWDYFKSEVTFPAPLQVIVTSESRPEVADCPDAHLKLFYLETLKPRLDAIEAKLDAVIANKQSEEMKAAQSTVDVESARISDVLDAEKEILKIGTE